MNFIIYTASHKEDVLQKNLMQSDFIKKYEKNLIVIKDKINVSEELQLATDILSVTGAYCGCDFNIYIHNDVWLPPDFEQNLEIALKQVPDDWGVLGVAGVVFENGVRKNKGHILDRGMNWGRTIDKPIPVQTLDELLLIVRCGTGLHFDPQFPQDFYGADICMQAIDNGYGVYVIPAFVHHNSSRKIGERTPSFYESEARFKAKWDWVEGQIGTTCSIIK